MNKYYCPICNLKFSYFNPLGRHYSTSKHNFSPEKIEALRKFYEYYR